MPKKLFVDYIIISINFLVIEHDNYFMYHESKLHRFDKIEHNDINI